MSVQTAPSTGFAALSASDGVSEGDGSPSGENPAVEAESVEQLEGEPDEGAPVDQDALPDVEPEGKSGPQNADTAEELKQARSEAEELRKLVAEIDDRIKSDPDMARKFYGADGRGGGDDIAALFEQTLRDPETGLTPAAADVVVRSMSPVLARLAQLEKRFGVIEPTVQRVAQTTGTAEFVQTISEAGVPSAVQKSQPFQKFLRTMRQDRTFASLERQNPGFAANHAASRWIATQSRAGTARDDRARIETVKTGRTATGTRSPSIAQRIVDVRRGSGDSHIMEADAIREQYAKAGKPLPQIRYVDRD